MLAIKQRAECTSFQLLNLLLDMSDMSGFKSGECQNYSFTGCGMCILLKAFTDVS
jgi:hypothetical protein